MFIGPLILYRRSPEHAHAFAAFVLSQKPGSASALSSVSIYTFAIVIFSKRELRLLCAL